jgi:hypothetical protein
MVALQRQQTLSHTVISLLGWEILSKLMLVDASERKLVLIV